MLWWARELFRSLRFLSANGQEGFWYSKRVYELVLPAIAALAAVLMSWLYPNVFYPDILPKLSSGLFQFMVFVVPFHLAALAAVATFSRPELDMVLKGTNVELRVWDNEQNEYFMKSLTLRQYTCLLFGYLCSIGMAFILVYIVVSGINFPWLLGAWSSSVAKLTLLLLVFFLTHYGILTVYAVTFLFEKVNDTEGR